MCRITTMDFIPIPYGSFHDDTEVESWFSSKSAGYEDIIESLHHRFEKCMTIGQCVEKEVGGLFHNHCTSGSCWG